MLRVNNIRKKISYWSNALVDLVLPPRCIACAQISTDLPFCKICQLSVSNVTNPCSRCGIPNLGSSSCPNCSQNPLHFDLASAPFLYGGQVAVAISRFKYEGLSYLASFLGTLLYQYLQSIECTADLVVPVPLHQKRLKQRGYNQSALLARKLAYKAKIPLSCTALVRIKNTLPQTQLNRKERWNNVKNAFWVNPKKVDGRSILLIDDVMTSGSTATSCSLALKENGATKIHVLTLARAVDVLGNTKRTLFAT